MKYATAPERKRVLTQTLDARTLPEIEAATQALRAWVQQNPEDVGIVEALEGLSLMRDIAEEQEAERARARRVAVYCEGRKWRGRRSLRMTKSPRQAFGSDAFRVYFRSEVL